VKPNFVQALSLLPMPCPKKQKSHLSRAHRLRECEQNVKELSASVVEVIMQRHSQLSEEELVGVQENHNADAEMTGELSDFENEFELEYTDEELQTAQHVIRMIQRFEVNAVRGL
jgi:hypothetical protein